MTEPEARTAKISEVWAEFSKQCGAKANCEHIVKIHSGKNDQTVRENLEKAVVYWAMLRAVLLERCKEVNDGSGYYTSFMVVTDSTKHHLMTCFKTSNHEWTDKARHETIETALEMSAAYAFWAWELKQRQNELQKG